MCRSDGDLKKIINDYFPGEVSPAGDEQPPPVPAIPATQPQISARADIKVTFLKQEKENKLTLQGKPKTSASQLTVAAFPVGLFAFSGIDSGGPCGCGGPL